jgi:hypothetical protein
MLQNIGSFFKPSITVSVDGYRSVYEYIRFPASWERLESNLLRLRQQENVMLGCRPTIQLYNVLSITDLLDYLENQEITWRVGLVVAPKYLSARLMSEEGKALAADRLRAFLQRSRLAAVEPALRSRVEMVIRDMMRPFPLQEHQQLLESFMQFTNDLDSTRGQSVHEALPEVSRYVSEAAGGWSNQFRFAQPSCDSRIPSPG